MKVDVLLGLQWGDEGKGKIVDVLAPAYDIIARFQGGPNAGHTLEFHNMKHILHTIPSGIFRENKINVIGNGLVIDPIIFKQEIEDITSKGFGISGNLFISKKAHLILPTHRLLDAASEASKGASKIGSTLKGIGPTYRDKTGREGIRVGDIVSGLEKKYTQCTERHKTVLEKIYGYAYKEQLRRYEKEWFQGIEVLKSFPLVDSEYLINHGLAEGKSVLAEGAQGTLLDIDFGSYPFVTSSNTLCAGACTGLGIAPQKIGRVIGIFKAYCTRVGQGPFPTELNNLTGEEMRKAGSEFGATTGRPRRCGWLDMVALKYAIMLNGVTELVITKADVLNQFKTIRVCTGYEMEGQVINQVPYEMNQNMKPVYTDLPGWNTNLTEITHKNHLPEELIRYIHFIERETGIPVSIASVGPKRKQTIALTQ
jgi:adenylosuccinate synthase